jgi:uncharacterized membrane protein YphA (DoxX/SURF4 family)
MFSIFPDRWPGLGLLLLRTALGIALIVQGAVYLGDRRDLGFWIWALAFAVIAAGLLLLVGFLTRLAAVAGAIIGVGRFFLSLPRLDAGPLQDRTTAALVTVIAVAVVSLGPGFLSVDARLFGRREIIIPPGSSRE